MRVLVVYASHYGSTKGIAERIGETLHDQGLDVELRSADAQSGPLAEEGFDAFIIGSAVHAGHWLRPAVALIRENAEFLAQHPAWLFSSGPIGEKYVHQPQPDPAEIAEFRSKIDVRGHVVFAGAFDPTKADLTRVGWLERQFSKRFLPVGDFRDWAEIEASANVIARELSAVPVG